MSKLHNDPENQPHQFNPDTVFHPNETVQEVAESLGIELPTYERISSKDCVYLQQRTGVDATFWMNLQANWDVWNKKFPNGLKGAE
jgi:plasmid maintenance system antidote protein VapI